MRPSPLFVLLLAVTALPGCNLMGGDNAEALAARREADGKAIGGACRHAGRAIEDCYTLNRKADKSAVYAGWREMNDYMRENKLDPVVPQLAAETSVAQAHDGAAEGRKAGKSGDKAGEKSADKTGDKAASKASGKVESDKATEKPRAKDAHSAAEPAGKHES